MKVLLFLLAIMLSSFFVPVEKDKCAKAFIKVKKSKRNSELFSDTMHLQTKYCNFYSDMKRSLSFSYLRTDSAMFLEFASLYMGEDGFKRKFVLGPNIAIGFIFKDGSNQIIRFEGPEQSLTNFSKSSTNRIALTNEMLVKLMTVEIVKFEIQNPFGQLNQTKVKTESLSSKQSKTALRIAHCFHDRVTK